MVKRSTAREVFEAHLECVLVPSLQPKRVMDNPSVHKAAG